MLHGTIWQVKLLGQLSVGHILSHLVSQGHASGVPEFSLAFGITSPSTTTSQRAQSIPPIFKSFL